MNKCFDENCSYRMKTSLTFDGAVLIIAEAFWWLLPYNIWLFICSKETKVSCKWSSKISMHCFSLHHQDTRTGKQDAKKKWVMKYKSQTLRLLQTGILQKHWQINLSAQNWRDRNTGVEALRAAFGHSSATETPYDKHTTKAVTISQPQEEDELQSAAQKQH